MDDVDYVKGVLAGDFNSSKNKEVPYPSLDWLKEHIEFDYASGKVSGEIPNGSESREGRPYLWFRFNDKRILSHRFIVAVTLGKWPPRAFHVDHINHDPSDNRPENLRVVTPRDNSRNRRRATLPELADIGKITNELAARKLAIEEARKKQAEISNSRQMAGRGIDSETVAVSAAKDPNAGRPVASLYSLPVGHPIFTGETKPAIPSGVWHKTTVGSWWWRQD